MDREGLPGGGTHGQWHGGEKQSVWPAVWGCWKVVVDSGHQERSWRIRVARSPLLPLILLLSGPGFPNTQLPLLTPPCDCGSLSLLGVAFMALLTVPSGVFPFPLYTVPLLPTCSSRGSKCSPVAKPPLVISVCGGRDPPPGPGKGRPGLLGIFPSVGTWTCILFSATCSVALNTQQGTVNARSL